jgi:diaminopimelate epimerase
MIRNLILKWCITTQMEVKALCVETEEDVWWLSPKTIENSATFNAVDGLHHATIKDDGIVSLQMIDVLNIKEVDYTFLDTGSPHHVQIVDDLEHYNVKKRSAIRYSELYGKQGSNINFVKKIDANTFRCAPMKSVEDETLAWNGCNRCCYSDECQNLTLLVLI